MTREKTASNASRDTLNNSAALKYMSKKCYLGYLIAGLQLAAEPLKLIFLVSTHIQQGYGVCFELWKHPFL